MKEDRTTPASVVGVADIALAWVEVDMLRPHGRRARTHSRKQIAQIAESIRTFGLSVPILVDEKGRILAGNGRLEAARLLGLQKVPVVMLAHLNDLQKRAFVIAENRMAELAGWDRSVLKAELDELVALDLTFDLDVIGFDDAAIDAIVLGDPATSTANAIPEAPELAVTRPGDVWLLGEHRLLCGDALDGASLKSVLGDEQARAIFTDPPYNVPVRGHVTKAGRHAEFAMASGEMSDEEFTEFLGRMWAQASTALVPGGLAYVCMDWHHARHVLQSCEDNGLDLVNLIVWDKVSGGMGSFYRCRHELIFLARTAGAQHTNRVELGRHGRDRSNVWSYEGMSGMGEDKQHLRSLHPTVKPAAMVRDALLDCTRRGELVLDLFAGSGTVLIAAEMARRRACAIEIEPRYCDVAIRRWEAFTGKEALLASSRQTFSKTRQMKSPVAGTAGG